MKCSCSECNRPLKSALPPGSNERPRQWFVTSRNVARSAFNGYRETWSDFSWIECRVCGAFWKTKAKFVSELQDCEYFPQRVAPRVPAWLDD